MKQSVEVMAYIYADIGGTLRALCFVDGIRIARRGDAAFDITSTPLTLPADFFSENIGHVAAIVGTNSSGKSTALQDICRILAGQRPVTARYALVMRSDQGVCQLCSDAGLVRFNGADVPADDAKRNTNLKVVFYAGGYDPLGRTGALVPRSTGVEFGDISDQYVYSNDPADDFVDKLFYLESLVEKGDSSLFLRDDGGRARTIRFEARSSQAANIAARDFLELLLTLTQDPDQRARLLAHLGIPSANDTADLFDIIDRQLILHETSLHFLADGPDYASLLRAYADANSPDDFFPPSLTFALSMAKLVAVLRADPLQPATLAQLQQFHVNFGTTVETMLGARFQAIVSGLHLVAANAGMLSDDGSGIDITINAKRDIAAAAHQVMTTLLLLRGQGLDFSFRFTGISEGQRTLLTFYSRLYVQAKRMAHAGNTLLLIDEHEHGLHPEWQRRYLQALITFLKKDHFGSERYQILLSTHSPFLVSDLPGSHVNRIGEEPDKATPTLAANLLELLLSPLFLENSTGEFSANKIAGFLKAVEAARDVESLEKASTLLPLLGDDLIRNYCTIRKTEKMRVLKARRG